jgi:Kdo2-lipid IVA lauroyltransferase/acyltransferase
MKAHLLSLLVRVTFFFARFLRYLPAPLVVRLGGFLGWMVSFFCPREIAIGAAQVRFARRKYPQMGGSDSPEALARMAFRHVGESIAELFLFEHLLSSGGCVVANEVPEREVFLAEKKPLLAISGHLGNFELLCAYHVKNGFDVTTFGKEPRYTSLSQFVDELRTAYGTRSVWRDGRKAAAAMIADIRAGKVLALLLDQDTDLRNAFSPFFGLSAASPVAAIELAVRLEVAIATTFIMREGPLRHRIITEFINYDPKDPLAGEKILRLYSERLEALIVQYPGQWLWWHRRWRRRPESTEVRSTKEYIEWLERQAPQS